MMFQRYEEQQQQQQQHFSTIDIDCTHCYSARTNNYSNAATTIFAQCCQNYQGRNSQCFDRVMRADPRYYYSNIGGSSTSTSRSRFEYEERQQQFHWSGRWGSGISTSISSGSVWHGSSFTSSHGNDWKMHSNDVVDSTTSTAAGTISSHPILQGLRELHDFLSVVESGSTFC